jgi:hypothetical protein
MIRRRVDTAETNTDVDEEGAVSKELVWKFRQFVKPCNHSHEKAPIKSVIPMYLPE